MVKIIFKLLGRQKLITNCKKYIQKCYFVLTHYFSKMLIITQLLLL